MQSVKVESACSHSSPLIWWTENAENRLLVELARK